MSRLERVPLRARMTLAFAAAAAVLLVALGVFLHQRLLQELDGSLRTGLEQRAGDLVRQVRGSETPDLAGQAPFERGDDIVQVVRPDGRVLAGAPGYGARSLLDGEQRTRARAGELLVTRASVDDDGPVRLLARPAGSAIVVVGAALEGRDEALGNLDGLLLVGVPVAILLASAFGYLVAGRALAPVERIRSQAEAIGAGDLDRRLPEPAAQDEVRRLSQTLNGMLGRLQAGFERERTFVADASHELRTPLARLKAELELASRPGRSPADLQAAIASSRVETEHLVRLTDDLLGLARSEGGQLPLHREWVRLDAIIGPASMRAGTADVLRVVGDPTRLVHVDPLRLQQALGNLLDNAVRHGEGVPQLRVSTSGSELVMEVRDEGAGIPPGLRPSAFDRFTRADAARSDGGAGLGLAIVAAIAVAHGGRAWVGADGEVCLRLAEAV